MERKTIYLCLAHMSEAGLEQKYVKEAFDTNWVVPMGPNVNAFEKDLEAFVNSKSDGSEELDRKVVCLSAGTAAEFHFLRFESSYHLSWCKACVRRFGGRDMEHGSCFAGEGYY